MSVRTERADDPEKHKHVQSAQTGMTDMRREAGAGRSFRGELGKRDGYSKGKKQVREESRYLSETDAGTDPVPGGAADEEPEADETFLEGRNAVLEAFRSGRVVEKLYVQEGLKDGPILTILREAAKHPQTILSKVSKTRLDQMSPSGRHQGVIAQAAAFSYAEVSEILERARQKGEAPFIILLDGIEDPHNLGAIIRTANQAGAHGVIIPKRRSVGLTSTAVRASAGAVHFTPVARVTNLGAAIDGLKKEGLWFVCADMSGEIMYKQNLTGPIGLVVGSEGEGVSRLVKEKCDFTASIPMFGDIDSLNASVAAGVMAYEIVRQRTMK